MILTAFGWLAALLCTAAAVYRAWCMLPFRRHAGTGKLRWRDAADMGNWTGLLLWSALAVAAFAALGVVGPLAGGVYAGAVTVIIALAGRVWTPEGRHALAGQLRYGITEPFAALRGRLGGGPAEAEASSPQAVVAEAIATRGIPSVLEDPALGLAPEPAELISGQVPAPAPYAALAQFIAGFEPEDDMSLRMFMEGNAAGSVMVADAWHHFADTCLNSVGLDPAYVAGILEAGDSAGGHGSLLAQIHKRFGVIYAAVKEWISAHGPLPHKAREFLTDDM
jgi:hypothetical protein